MERKRSYFGIDAIEHMLGRIGKLLQGEVHSLLIGGGAMSFKGNKDVTKDVDVVIVDNDERTEFIRTIEAMGFVIRRVIPTTYRQMNARIFANANEFQIDVFPRLIGKRFVIRDEIIERAEFYRAFHSLHVNLLSDEDIFLSKAVTERDHDLVDMYTLFKKNLDEETIISELKKQTEISSTTLWGTFLTRKLYELEKVFDTTIPWKVRVEKLAIEEMETMLGMEPGSDESDYIESR